MVIMNLSVPATQILSLQHPQTGMTLIEVLVSLLLLTTGLMGAAVLQLNALKYTDGSRVSAQTSFIAYDILDRIRASGLGGRVHGQDLKDFQDAAREVAGPTANASLVGDRREVNVSIDWDSARFVNVEGAREVRVLSSQMAAEPSP